MNVGSLFSGIGGMDAGLAAAGHDHVFFCESDPWRREVLAARWPGIPVYDDVREVALGRVAWNKGKSYTIAKRDVYANKGTWNAAMRRMHSARCMRCGWNEAACDTHHIQPKRDGGEMTLDNGIILCPNCHRLADSGSISVYELRSLRDHAPIIGERIGEVVPSEVPHVDLLCGGFPERAKTSQSPDVEPDSLGLGQDSSMSSRESLTLFNPDGFSSRMFQVRSVARAVGTSESCLERWPTSGTAWAGGFSTAVSSECRSADGVCSSSEPALTEILQPPQDVPVKYSLSARAAQAILRRAHKRGRQLPSHLSVALEQVARTTTTDGQTA